MAVETTTSELVSNVVLHTNGGGVLRAWDPKPDVPFRIEVEDRDPRLPVTPEWATEAGGRGLRMVDSLADGWGVNPTPEGKTVWAEFNRPI